MIENCAISEGAEATLHLDKQILRGSVQQETGVFIKVPARSIRELEAKYGPFNVMIMDIQGAEQEALHQCETLLDHYRLVIVEWHPSIIGPDSVEQSRKMLLGKGFRVTARMGDVEAYLKNL
jgi:hypothetical protein